jgi:hypothetical protein
MSIDYIVSSLPALRFGEGAPLSWERFVELAGEAAAPSAKWRGLETLLRNAVAEGRGGERWKRPADGCSVFWKNRVLACFQEKDIARRDEMLDKVWWDAAGELVPPESPLGRGALEAYAIRLKIAIKRSKMSKEAGKAVFDRLTSATSKVV